MAVNTMISEIDHLIRDLVPRVFDAAGLKIQSKALRKMAPIRNKEAVISMCSFLSEMNTSPLSGLKEPSWDPIIRDVLFWSEASIWTAVMNDNQECAICVLFVKRNMDDAWSKFVDH